MKKLAQPIYWPDATQELMLRTCLEPGPAALAAWEKWLPQVDFDNLDNGSNRFLPLLHHNLQRAGCTHPLMDRLKGIYRFYWAQNQFLFHQAAAPMLAAFQQQGIKTLLLKGTALIARHYQDPGLRPMGDFDFMVPLGQATAGMQCLQANGWRLDDPTETLEHVRRSSYAGYFVNARRQHLDLHWFMMAECQQPGLDDAVWQHAVPVKIGNVETLCASSTDLLFHVCAHGAVWNIMSPVRWVPDAVYIFRTAANEIDWDRLLAQARQRHFTLPLYGTLSYLQEKFAAPVPLAILSALRHSRRSRVEVLEYEHRLVPRGLLGALPEHFFNYWRLTRHAEPRRSLLGFPGYLSQRWGLRSSWQMPVHITRRAWERFQISTGAKRNARW